MSGGAAPEAREGVLFDNSVVANGKLCGEGAQGADPPVAGAGAWAALILRSQGIAKPLFGGGRVDKVVKSIVGSEGVSDGYALGGAEYFTKCGKEFCWRLAHRRLGRRRRLTSIHFDVSRAGTGDCGPIRGVNKEKWIIHP